MAAALVNPHLLGPLSHNYASLVVCLDLLWCIWVRTYTREWGPRGQDRNLESPRKSTLDFREAPSDKVNKTRQDKDAPGRLLGADASRRFGCQKIFRTPIPVRGTKFGLLSLL